MIFPLDPLAERGPGRRGLRRPADHQIDDMGQLTRYSDFI